jgi:hypothetical protein
MLSYFGVITYDMEKIKLIPQGEITSKLVKEH